MVMATIVLIVTVSRVELSSSYENADSALILDVKPSGQERKHGCFSTVGEVVTNDYSSISQRPHCPLAFRIPILRLSQHGPAVASVDADGRLAGWSV